LGIGDWGLGPIPNPQSPIPNPQSPCKIFFILKYRKKFGSFNLNLFINLNIFKKMSNQNSDLLTISKNKKNENEKSKIQEIEEKHINDISLFILSRIFISFKRRTMNL